VGEPWRRTLVVGLAFLLAIAGTFVFATRAGRRARQIHAANEPIREWMSIPFIAHAQHVPASVLFQAVGVQPNEPHDRRSVRHIARDLNRPVPELMARLQRAIDAAAQLPGGPIVLNDQFLAAVSQYGAPALFGIVTIAAIGVPLPITLLLIVAGSMISQGAMSPWWAIGAAASGSILGDQGGYAIGRWGRPIVVAKLSGLFGSHASLPAMEAKAKAWGGPGIFITRWLLSPLGPWINLASGTAGYPWHRFLFWDILGVFTRVAVCISLGRFFSDRVMSLYAVLGDLTWATAALLAAIIPGYLLLTYLRKARVQ
jgi:membrane protein DedA with SNARE-associated domain